MTDSLPTKPSLENLRKQAQTLQKLHVDEVGQFVAHCMAGDAQAAHAMLHRTPDLLARAPNDMVSRAVWTKQ